MGFSKIYCYYSVSDSVPIGFIMMFHKYSVISFWGWVPCNKLQTDVIRNKTATSNVTDFSESLWLSVLSYLQVSYSWSPLSIHSLCIAC